MKILVIDDEREFAQAIARSLTAQGHELEQAHSGAEGLLKAAAFAPQAVLLDINMPDINGLQLLPDLLKARPGCGVVMITGQASHKSAVRAMKEGAEDYVEKPFDLDELQAILARLSEKAELKLQLSGAKRARVEDYAREYLFLSDPAMQKVYRDLEEVAPRDAVTVLIQGETGTGKEHAARLLHLFSNRAQGPFVELHCAALPETLLESELFGHEAGAFTDARARKQGLFETAQGGTLFLDEIGELSLAVQAKLLKVLEEKTLRRLGGVQNVALDVRLVTASNRDLSAEASAGRFRPDLYYRLNVFNVTLPPLRQRPSDLKLLGAFFFDNACQAFGKRLAPLGAEALEALVRHSWPGNVRELKNFIERLVLQAGPAPLGEDDVLGSLPEPERAAAAKPEPQEINLGLLESTLRQAGGDKSRAAALLGVSRPTLYRHLRKFGLHEGKPV
jgi:DNA-binding NtrC family response regulator